MILLWPQQCALRHSSLLLLPRLGSCQKGTTKELDWASWLVCACLQIQCVNQMDSKALLCADNFMNFLKQSWRQRVWSNVSRRCKEVSQPRSCCSPAFITFCIWSQPCSASAGAWSWRMGWTSSSPRDLMLLLPGRVVVGGTLRDYLPSWHLPQLQQPR